VSVIARQRIGDCGFSRSMAADISLYARCRTGKRRAQQCAGAVQVATMDAHQVTARRHHVQCGGLHSSSFVRSCGATTTLRLSKQE
jgi:hypothetical protein